MTIRAVLTLGLLAATLGFATSPASAATNPFATGGVCPNVLGQPALVNPGLNPLGTAKDCTLELTINDPTLGAALDIQAVPSNSTAGLAYEADDDVLVGVWNNTSASIPAITLHGVDIFGFDGDGISLYTGAPTGFFGYEGPDNTFQIFDSNNGWAVFNTPLAPGATTYFSLEFPNASSTVVVPPGGLGGQSGFVPAPEPASLALLGMGLLGLGASRRRR